jgi:hypothetical protein
MQWKALKKKEFFLNVVLRCGRISPLASRERHQE